jgi:hypothetical protein
MTQFIPGELTFYSRVLMSTVGMALLHEAADKKRRIFLDPSEERKMSPVTSGLRLNVAADHQLDQWLRYINLPIQHSLEIIIKIQSAIIQL